MRTTPRGAFPREGDPNAWVRKETLARRVADGAAARDAAGRLVTFVVITGESAERVGYFSPWLYGAVRTNNTSQGIEAIFVDPSRAISSILQLFEYVEPGGLFRIETDDAFAIGIEARTVASLDGVEAMSHLESARQLASSAESGQIVLGDTTLDSLRASIPDAVRIVALDESRWRLVPPPPGLRILLFTEIMDVIASCEEQADVALELLAFHDWTVRAEIDRHEGHMIELIEDRGVAGFAEAHQALECALAIQQEFRKTTVDDGRGFRLRMRVEAGSVGHFSFDNTFYSTPSSPSLAPLNHDDLEMVLSKEVFELLGDSPPGIKLEKVKVGKRGVARRGIESYAVRTEGDPEIGQLTSDVWTPGERNSVVGTTTTMFRRSRRSPFVRGLRTRLDEVSSFDDIDLAGDESLLKGLSRSAVEAARLEAWVALAEKAKDAAFASVLVLSGLLVIVVALTLGWPDVPIFGVENTPLELTVTTLLAVGLLWLAAYVISEVSLDLTPPRDWWPALRKCALLGGTFVLAVVVAPPLLHLEAILFAGVATLLLALLSAIWLDRASLRVMALVSVVLVGSYAGVALVAIRGADAFPAWLRDGLEAGILGAVALHAAHLALEIAFRAVVSVIDRRRASRSTEEEIVDSLMRAVALVSGKGGASLAVEEKRELTRQLTFVEEILEMHLPKALSGDQLSSRAWFVELGQKTAADIRELIRLASMPGENSRVLREGLREKLIVAAKGDWARFADLAETPEMPRRRRTIDRIRSVVVVAAPLVVSILLTTLFKFSDTVDGTFLTAGATTTVAFLTNEFKTRPEVPTSGFSRAVGQVGEAVKRKHEEKSADATKAPERNVSEASSPIEVASGS